MIQSMISTLNSVWPSFSVLSNQDLWSHEVSYFRSFDSSFSITFSRLLVCNFLFVLQSLPDPALDIVSLILSNPCLAFLYFRCVLCIIFERAFFFLFCMVWMYSGQNTVLALDYRYLNTLMLLLVSFTKSLRKFCNSTSPTSPFFPFSLFPVLYSSSSFRIFVFLAPPFCCLYRFVLVEMSITRLCDFAEMVGKGWNSPFHFPFIQTFRVCERVSNFQDDSNECFVGMRCR